MKCLVLSSILSLTFLKASASSDFRFGDHAVDQCPNPITTITNTVKILTVFPPRDSNGNCSNELCLGDCVTVVVNGGGLGQSPPINVILGADLPNPGDCSRVAEQNNYPPGWDFTHNGMCGKGASGEGYWHNCFVHDVCVWARCTDDTAIPGGISIKVLGMIGGSDDPFCGKAFEDAKTDWRKANVPILGCFTDAGCPDPMICRFGKCSYPRPDGDYSDRVWSILLTIAIAAAIAKFWK